jgi:hypothetical protein
MQERVCGGQLPLLHVLHRRRRRAARAGAGPRGSPSAGVVCAAWQECRKGEQGAAVCVGGASLAQDSEAEGEKKRERQPTGVDSC